MKIRWHWGMAVVLVYVAFASATVGFVVFAVAHPAALVTDDYYGEALRHDRRIEAAANGRAAAASLDVARDAGGALMATLHLPASHHANGRGTITWYRPSEATFDRSLPLQIDDNGVQQIPMAGIAAGRWRVKVEWDVDGRPYYFERTVTVAP